MRNWRRSGIKIESYHQYEMMLEAQGHMCAICGVHVNGSGCLDHDHDTGEPRGVLCHGCNVSLGRIGKHLQEAVNYVEQFKRKEDA